MDLHEWNSEQEVGTFIASIINMVGAKDIIEVGTFEGATASAILTQTDANLCMIDIEDHRTTDFKKFCTKHKARATFVLKDSMKVTKDDLPFKADLIFFDGVHEFNHQVKEFQKYEKMHSKPHTYFLFHDTIHIAELRKFVEWISKFYQVVNLNTPEKRGLAIVYGFKL